MIRRPYINPDPFWAIIHANYTTAEVAGYVQMADTLEELARRAQGWSRKV